jgi:hypothetical protein
MIRILTVGAPLRIGKHSLVGRTSNTNAVQTPDFSIYFKFKIITSHLCV